MRLFSCEQKHGILFFGQKVVRKVSQYKFSSGTKKVKKMNTSSLLGATHQSKILTWKSAFRLFFFKNNNNKVSTTIHSATQKKNSCILNGLIFTSPISPPRYQPVQQLAYPINLSILKMVAASSDQMSFYWAFDFICGSSLNIFSKENLILVSLFFAHF